MRGVFVTGTDTAVGKTYVCRALIDTLGESLRVTYMKPVQTGCEADGSGRMIAPDLAYVMGSALVCRGDDNDHAPYRFAPSCSPHLAARLAGKAISVDRIRRACERLSACADLLIVEGAGGVLVPVGQGRTMLDIMKELGLPVIVVSSPRLGTLNHTLLTLAALRHEALRVAAVIVNNAGNAPRDLIYDDNCETLRSLVAPVPLIELDYSAPLPRSLREFCHEAIERPLQQHLVSILV